MRVLMKSKFQLSQKADYEKVKTTKKSPKKKKVYECRGCGFICPRFYNLRRHETRIHIEIDPRLCCRKILLTKGEWYYHVEKYHPELRKNSIISKIKYKIVASAKNMEEKLAFFRREKTNFANCSGSEKNVSTNIPLQVPKQEIEEDEVSMEVEESLPPSLKTEPDLNENLPSTSYFHPKIELLQRIKVEEQNDDSSMIVEFSCNVPAAEITNQQMDYLKDIDFNRI